MTDATPMHFFWCSRPVAFRAGETIAAALQRAGLTDLGPGVGGISGRYFCGIGSCQCCLVTIDGASPVEACLTVAQEGMYLAPALPEHSACAPGADA